MSAVRTYMCNLLHIHEFHGVADVSKISWRTVMGLARNRSTPTNLEIRRGRVSPSGDTCPVSGIKQYGDWSHAKSARRGTESNLAGFGLGGSFKRDGVGMSRIYTYDTDRKETNRRLST